MGYSQTENEIRQQVLKDQGAIGINISLDEQFLLSSFNENPQDGIRYIYIQQLYKGLKVHNQLMTLVYKGSKLVYTSGNFLNNISQLVTNTQPGILPASAVLASAKHLRLNFSRGITETRNEFHKNKKLFFSRDGIAKKEIETELLWAKDDAGKLHLAWNVNIDVANSPDWWNVRIDANSGQVINKDNWTIHEKNPSYVIEKTAAERNNSNSVPAQQRITNSYNAPGIQMASYHVIPFPFESLVAGGTSIENNPWLRAGVGNDATTYGWHFDGTTDYLITRGNNVHAYEDSAGTNIIGRSVASSTPAPFITFHEMPDFSKPPFDSSNRNFSILNLFYWNNLLHDLTYQYGFNEASGNFQSDNLGRGGSGNDYVKAEAQDGSGIDNANFSSPPDGNNGRMQMYLWSSPLKLNVVSPMNIAGSFEAVESMFSINNKLINRPPITGEASLYNDAASNGTTHDACNSNTLPTTPIDGKIAIIFGGACDYTVKAKAAQNAGAIAVIIINHVHGSIFSMGGTDNTITIPAIMISQSDGSKILSALPNGVRLNITAPVQMDGDIDNGIIAHEFGHGVSNRLTGGRNNASCLSNAEQAGEGWSDYLSLMMTTDWQTATLNDGTKARLIGSYVSGHSAPGKGIRRVPYSTDMSIDTVTYRSLDGNTTFGNGEVHNIGEVWCSALWDMTWNIINQEGSITKDIFHANSNGGNVIALKLVMEGMRLQPCRPGFLDSRNAILAADSILFQGRYKCAIWNAFARRGMGYNAVQGLSTSTADQIASFDVPSAVSLKKSGAPISIGSGNQGSISVQLSCGCELPPNGVTVSDTIPEGFSYISSNGGTEKDNVVTFTNVGFTKPLQTVSYSIIVKANTPPCNMIRIMQDDRLENITAGFVAERLSGNMDWVTSNNRSNKNPNAWFAADGNTASNFTITSDAFVPSSLSVLSFWHFYVTEHRVDGGKVEISEDNGTSWQDAGPYFFQNGYNGKLQNNAPQPGTNSFTGTSYSTGSLNEGQFIESLVNLSAFSEKQIRIRFRFQTNNFNANNQSYQGWYIDDITVTNGCGGLNKAIIIDENGSRMDSSSTPLFVVTAAALPLNLLSFTARQEGMQGLLKWTTSNEVNTKIFYVEKSIDGINWRTAGSLSAKNYGAHAYEYAENNLVKGNNHYRLKMVDKDGRFTYSSVRTIDFKQPDNFSIIPNPAGNYTTIYFGKTVRAALLQVVDLQGRIVANHSIKRDSEYFLLNTSSLLPGTYLLKLDLANSLLIRKLVISR